MPVLRLRRRSRAKQSGGTDQQMDSGSRGKNAAASKRQPQQSRRQPPVVEPVPRQFRLNPPVIVFCAVLLFFGIYYFWTAAPCSTWHMDCSPTPVRTQSGEIIGPYNMLADSFLTGHVSLLARPDPRMLQLPDPRDPLQNARYRLHDLSLYKGNYYMAFGPVPTLLLFAPFRFVTGSYLPDAIGCAILALGAYLVSCLALRLFLRKLFPALPAWVFPFLCLGLGFCNTFPYLLRRPAVYETAIVSGQLFLMLAILLIGRVVLGASRLPLLAAGGGGTMALLAFASRPLLLLPACGLFVILLISSTTSAERRRKLLAATVPFIAGGLLLAWYNYARFDSPFEFGYHYQLAGIKTDEHSFLQAGRFPLGLYFYLFSPPTLSSAFPFIHLAPGAAFRIPADYSARLEPVAGILWFTPLLILLPAPWFWKQKLQTPFLKKWVVVLVVSAIAVLCLDGSIGATMRYEADVTGLVFLAASLVSAWLLLCGPPRVRSLAPGILVTAVSLGICLNFAIGITGCYDLLKKLEPGQYRAIESFFYPVARILAALDVQP